MCRFQWTVLPQGVSNSSTMCQYQYFVYIVLHPIRARFPHTYVFHSMMLSYLHVLMTGSFRHYIRMWWPACWLLVYRLPPRKFKCCPHMNIWFMFLSKLHYIPRKISIYHQKDLKTLNDFQNLHKTIIGSAPPLEFPTQILATFSSPLKGSPPWIVEGN